MAELRNEVICELKITGDEEFGTFAEQLAALKEEPLEVAPEVKPPEEAEEKEEGKKPLLPKKKLKPEEEAAVARVSGMLSSGLVQGLKSGDVKGAIESMGTQLATSAATSVLNTVMQSALSFIPGVGPLLGGLFSGLKFQREGLVRSPTLALVGEREPYYRYVTGICQLSANGL